MTRRVGLAAIFVLLAGCAGKIATPQASTSATTTPAPTASEGAVPVESSPPGDIPDSIQFVPFRSSAGHFEVRVPEGWAKTANTGKVSFSDKLNTVAVEWRKQSSAPTRGSVTNKQVPELKRTERAFQLGGVLDCANACTIPYSTAPISVNLPAGPAVIVTYKTNSAPNDVTGKRYRLEDVRFDFYKNGIEADLVLSGPVGSDNVDPWKLVSQSFRWV